MDGNSVQKLWGGSPRLRDDGPPRTGMDSGPRWPPLTVQRDCAFFRQRIDQEVRAKSNFALSARPSTSAWERFQTLQQPALLRLPPTINRGDQRLEHLRAARQQEQEHRQRHQPIFGGTPRPALHNSFTLREQPASTNATPRRELMPLQPSPRVLLPLPPSPRVLLPPRTPGHQDVLGQMLSGPGTWHEPPLIMARAFHEPPRVFTRYVEASTFRSSRPAAPLLPWKSDFAT